MELREKCAVIDRRGLTANVESAFCEDAAQYICELRGDANGDPPDVCKVIIDAEVNDGELQDSFVNHLYCNCAYSET